MFANDVLVNLFGNGGVLYIIVQIIKGVLVIVQNQFPNIKPKPGFMAWVTLVVGLLLFGGIGAAEIQGMETATIVEMFTEIANLLLQFVQVVAGAFVYYQAFKKSGVPLLGYSITGEK